MGAPTAGRRRAQQRPIPIKRRPPTIRVSRSTKFPLSFSFFEDMAGTQVRVHYRSDWGRAAVRRVKAYVQVCYVWCLNLLGGFCLQVRAPFVLLPKARQVYHQITARLAILISCLGTIFSGVKGTASQCSSASSTVAAEPLFGLDGSANMFDDIYSLEESDDSDHCSSDLAKKKSRLPFGLAGLELYEAIMRPADKAATVDVTFDTRTYQWQLSRADSGKLPWSQLTCLRGREEKVMVLCSKELLAGLASDGSSIIVYDQKGKPSKHLTQVHHLSQKHGVPGFWSGELSRLRLSSHDAFKIRNLKEFLLYASAGLDTVTSVTAGPYMKTWVVNLSQLVDIMDDKWTYGACRTGFFKLYKRGFAHTVYLQLLDGDYAIGSDTMKDAQIMLPSFWMSHYADFVPPSLRINTMKAFSFFCADEHLLIRPQLHVIHPNATPSRAPPHQQNLSSEDCQRIGNGGGAFADHQPLHQKHAHFAPVPGSYPKAVTLPTSCNIELRAHDQPCFRNPLPYPQPQTRELSPATKKALLRHISLATRAGPPDAVATSPKAASPDVVQNGVSGQYSLQNAGYDELPNGDGTSRKSAPHDDAQNGSVKASRSVDGAKGLHSPANAGEGVSACEEERTCLGSSISQSQPLPMLKQLPLSFYYEDPAGHLEWIQASDTENAFWEQIDSVVYSQLEMKKSGLVYNPEVKDWASPSGDKPLAVERMGGAGLDGPWVGDGRETREKDRQDEILFETVRGEDVEHFFQGPWDEVDMRDQSQDTGVKGCDLSDAANGNSGAESNGLNGGCCNDDVAAASADTSCRSLKNEVVEVPGLAEKVFLSSLQSLREKTPASVTNENGKAKEKDAALNEPEQPLRPACEDREHSSDKTVIADNKAWEINLYIPKGGLNNGAKEILESSMREVADNKQFIARDAKVGRPETEGGCENGSDIENSDATGLSVNSSARKRRRVQGSRQPSENKRKGAWKGREVVK